MHRAHSAFEHPAMLRSPPCNVAFTECGFNVYKNETLPKTTLTYAKLPSRDLDESTWQTPKLSSRQSNTTPPYTTLAWSIHRSEIGKRRKPMETAHTNYYYRTRSNSLSSSLWMWILKPNVTTASRPRCRVSASTVLAVFATPQFSFTAMGKVPDEVGPASFRRALFSAAWTRGSLLNSYKIEMKKTRLEFDS